MSDGPSDSRQIYNIRFDGCPGPSNMRESSDFLCFIVVRCVYVAHYGVSKIMPFTYQKV
jgi:hypothetical protein